MSLRCALDHTSSSKVFSPKRCIAQPAAMAHPNSMNFKGWLLTAALVTISAHAQTAACIGSMPDYLRSAVEQDRWKIVQPEDLAGDLHIFKGNHPGQCPGVTSGNFYPKADSSYVVALIKHDDQNHLLEKTLLVTLKKSKTETAVIIPPTPMPAVAVVWKIPPGRWRGIDGTKASISHDSFVSEQIISTATQYYYDGKHLKSFPLSR